MGDQGSRAGRPAGAHAPAALAPHDSSTTSSWSSDSGLISSRRPRRARRRRLGLLLGAAGLTAVLAAAAALQLASPSSGPGSTAVAPAPSPASSPVASPAPTSAPSTTSSQDQTGADDTSGLLTAPQGITWTLFRGMALPTSATDGPTRIDGSVYAGFSHTPTGALLAAEQIAIRLPWTTDGGWRQVLQQQTAGQAGQAQAETVLSHSNDGLPPHGWAQYAGFKFVTYSPDLAVISVATRNGQDGYRTCDLTVQWSDGDWKLQIPSSGVITSEQVDTIATYVPFAGVQ